MVRTLRGDSKLIKIALLVENDSTEGQHRVTAVQVTKAPTSYFRFAIVRSIAVQRMQ